MPQDQSLKMRGGFLYLDTQSFMAPKVRQKARCHSCGVKGEQPRNRMQNHTCLQRRAGVRARGKNSGYGQPKGGRKGGLNPLIIINTLIFNIFVMDCGAPIRQN